MQDSKLTNHEFMAKVIELYSYIYVMDTIFILDLNYVIVFAGEGVSKLVNRPLAALLNQDCFSALPIPPENIPRLKDSLAKVVATRKTHEFLSVNLNHHHNTFILHCLEKPLINPATTDIVGFSIESREIDYPLYYSKILMLSDPVTPTDSSYSDELLTRREHEIAFLLFHYSSSEKIAEIISKFADKGVSAKTVRNIISQQLYPKFGVYNSEALLAKLHTLNYHKKIPPSLLVNQHLDLSLV